MNDSDVMLGILPFVAEYRPHVIVNGVFSVSQDPASFVQNSKNPALFAIIARSVGARFFHLSDSSMFRSSMPDDTTKPYPQEIYGLSRLIGERAVMSVHKKATIVRMSWLYGIDIPESPPMIAWAHSVGVKKNAHIYDDITVSPTYVGDAASLLATRILMGPSVVGVVHLGPNVSKTWFELLREEFPRILPLKSQRLLLTQGTSRSVAVTPSKGWILSTKDGFNRFMGEVKSGGFPEGEEASK
jgi:dTDP-4-dehydrorhamnose reductase